MNFQELLYKIKNSFEANLPFVVYSKPNKKQVQGIFQNNNQLHYLKNYKEKGFVFAPFDNREKIVLFPLDKSDIHSVKASNEYQFIENKISIIKTDLSKLEHVDLVTKGIQFIKDKKAEKVVLSRKEEVQSDGFSITKTFSNILSSYNNAFVYVWYHPKIGLWLGATPETLISVENNQFKTVALAGTQTYKGSLDVKWQSKEIEEQQIVTNYIFSQINTKIENLKTSKPYTVKAGDLMHLKTDISGTLKKHNDLQILVENMHPTPAVCGMPKEIAKEFILDNENYNREYYTGFLGELNLKNNSHLFVNLRCMKIINNIASIYIGGGITKDSVAEKEWQETVEKCKVMKKVLVN